MTKDNFCGVRLDDIERARLEALASAVGVSRQDVIRMLIKRAHDEHARGPRQQ